MIVDFIHPSTYVSFTSRDFSHLLIRIEKAVKICTLDAAATIPDKIVLDNRAAFLRLHTSTVHQRGVLLIPGTAHRLAALGCRPFTFYRCFSRHSSYLLYFVSMPTFFRARDTIREALQDPRAVALTLPFVPIIDAVCTGLPYLLSLWERVRRTL